LNDAAERVGQVVAARLRVMKRIDGDAEAVELARRLDIHRFLGDGDAIPYDIAVRS